MATVKKLFQRRQRRTRSAIARNAVGRLRLSVFRSSKHIYAQVIDDAAGRTVASASSMDEGLRKSLKTGADTQDAFEQEYFPDSHIKTNFLCNLGYGDPAKLFPRSPRLTFDEACKLL